MESKDRMTLKEFHKYLLESWLENYYRKIEDEAKCDGCGE